MSDKIKLGRKGMFVEEIAQADSTTMPVLRSIQELDSEIRGKRVV